MAEPLPPGSFRRANGTPDKPGRSVPNPRTAGLVDSRRIPEHLKCDFAVIPRVDGK